MSRYKTIEDERADGFPSEELSQTFSKLVVETQSERPSDDALARWKSGVFVPEQRDALSIAPRQSPHPIWPRASLGVLVGALCSVCVWVVTSQAPNKLSLPTKPQYVRPVAPIGRQVAPRRVPSRTKFAPHVGEPGASRLSTRLEAIVQRCLSHRKRDVFQPPSQRSSPHTQAARLRKHWRRSWLTLEVSMPSELATQTSLSSCIKQGMHTLRLPTKRGPRTVRLALVFGGGKTKMLRVGQEAYLNRVIKAVLKACTESNARKGATLSARVSLVLPMGGGVRVGAFVTGGAMRAQKWGEKLTHCLEATLPKTQTQAGISLARFAHVTQMRWEWHWQVRSYKRSDLTFRTTISKVMVPRGWAP